MYHMFIYMFIYLYHVVAPIEKKVRFNIVAPSFTFVFNFIM